MNKFILASFLATIAGCSSTCKELVQIAPRIDTVPRKMGILIDGTDIQADEPGAKFLADYVTARTTLEAIKQECSK